MWISGLVVSSRSRPKKWFGGSNQEALMRVRHRVILVAVCLLAACVVRARTEDHHPVSDLPPVDDLGIERWTPPDTVGDIAGVQSRLFRDGRVYIAGQPDEGALAMFKDRGVTVVVNLRPYREMQDRERVSFDEEAAVARLGLDYIHIPLGGDDHPYTPAAVDRFAQVLVAHTGPVLLHCSVAWRASYLWIAYLIRYQGFSLDEAYARGRAIGIGPNVLAELLGEPLKLVYEKP